MNRATHNQSFQPVGLQDFLALQVPSREMLLAPILPERSLAMLYSPRGMGKSWLSVTIGLAVASGGSVLRWSAPKPRRVLLVDGEMLLSDLQTRLNLILAGLGTKIPNDGFRVLAADHTERGINLSSGEGQQELERHLDGVDLLILHNLSTLLANGSEGASDAWLPMQNWLLKLRRRGASNFPRYTRSRGAGRPARRSRHCRNVPLSFHVGSAEGLAGRFGFSAKYWSEWQDLNLRPPRPERGDRAKPC
jgi:AAA domain